MAKNGAAILGFGGGSSTDSDQLPSYSAATMEHEELALKVIHKRRSPNKHSAIPVAAPIVPTQVPIKHLVDHNMDLESNSVIGMEHSWRPLPQNINNDKTCTEHPPVTLSDGVLADSSDSVELNPHVFPNAHQSEKEHDETDDEVFEVMQTFARVIKDINVMIPSKSQVLLYFANAQAFRLRRIGTDLQVTDPADFPLFDVWVEMDCCRCTWVIEAYGKVVMMMHEKPSNFCCGPRRPPISISDWNGDLFGYLVPGDPFLLQNTERQTIAKLIPHASAVTSQSDLLNHNHAESHNGITPLPLDESVHNANTNTTSSLMQESVMLNDIAVTSCNGDTATAQQALCWLCVMEGTGRHIVRLDGFDSIQYNKEVSFQLKLLALAAVIR